MDRSRDRSISPHSGGPRKKGKGRAEVKIEDDEEGPVYISSGDDAKSGDGADVPQSASGRTMPLRCEICNKLYNKRIRHLRSHLIKRHHDTYRRCGLCQMAIVNDEDEAIHHREKPRCGKYAIAERFTAKPENATPAQDRHHVVDARRLLNESAKLQEFLQNQTNDIMLRRAETEAVRDQKRADWDALDVERAQAEGNRDRVANELRQVGQDIAVLERNLAFLRGEQGQLRAAHEHHVRQLDQIHRVLYTRPGAEHLEGGPSRLVEKEEEQLQKLRRFIDAQTLRATEVVAAADAQRERISQPIGHPQHDTGSRHPTPPPHPHLHQGAAGPPHVPHHGEPHVSTPPHKEPSPHVKKEEGSQ